ncbi:MAG: acyltransferase [Candidatus Edwardsbacteria bacterium]|nr:acyltransferase [Candidatus Edwardsbacteria bacterium]MBU1575645.1 acyltransferase [Candidatus Edwardsbacteria bacterium]MBU2462529.1 acyltransferase [Candidatus Edwardsbacteria bacterium]MBU2594641.1 acyltransferase [Candidatus Edwardsbacteria bacterium]
MKIGFAQFNPAFGQVDKNLSRIERLIGRRQADLLVLPELCTTGYNFISKKEVRVLSETTRGKTVNYFKEISKRTKINIVAGFAEKEGSKIYNSAVLVRPSGKIDVYRKTHLFGNEKKYFSPGNTGFKVFSVGQVKIGMMICFDWIFPEAARSLALQGAQVICHPANLVLPYCPDSMPVRALENRVFTVTANRIGRESRGGNDLKFIGQSVIAGPNARVLSRAPADKETVSIVDIDPAMADNKRITPVNDLFKDRRPAFYKRIIRK